MKNGKLNGKVAVVTGASKGIGAGIAKQLAAEGASVVINYASAKSDADKVVDEIAKGGGKAVAIQGSVIKKADVEKLFAAAEKALGKIDILVNNADVYQFAPLEQITEDDFHRQYDTNVLGLILVTQEGVKHFGPEGGSVINVSSLASTTSLPMAAVLGPKKIRVNSINPGPVETEGFQSAGFSGSDFEKQAVAKTPLGRMGRPDDIAPAAVFFASDDSKWITGETLVIAGGLR